MDSNRKKNRTRIYIPLIAIVIVVVFAAILWYREYKLYISTDDAKIDSDNVSASSKILGRIARLYIDEGDTVKIGMLLADLDSTDLLAQKKQSISAKAQAIANEAQTEAKYQFDLENIKVNDVNLTRATDDYNRAKNQIAGDVITQEQFDHIQKAFETAKAQLQVAKTQLEVSKAQIGTAAASVESADAQIGVISAQLKNTKLYAPMDGVIAKRWLLAGDVIQPGQSIFTITNNKLLWVIVFLEETNISNVHPGQKARFTIDAFSGVKFYGKVFSIGANTASMFSLIPANNASGNFTKVTQRIPVKISIDGVEGTNNLNAFNILTGMSVVVKIVKE